MPANIADQYDFVTAYASANRKVGIVSLDFKHQFAMVELTATGGNPYYNVEIAGVCIGNPVVEADFNLGEAAHAPATVTGAAQAGNWNLPDQLNRRKVRYIFGTNDKIVKVDENTAAKTLMGKGGNAMVIPAHTDKWDPANDPAINQPKYKTDKMYFSVLVRVIRRADGKQMFPYSSASERDGMRSEWFAIDASGNIKAHKDSDGKYYDAEQKEYTPADGEEFEFCWASIPVETDWKAGMKYVYQLQYASGIGVRDPEDPHPGDPILGEEIKFSVTLSPWGDAGTEPIDVPSEL